MELSGVFLSHCRNLLLNPSKPLIMTLLVDFSKGENFSPEKGLQRPSSLTYSLKIWRRWDLEKERDLPKAILQSEVTAENKPVCWLWASKIPIHHVGMWYELISFSLPKLHTLFHPAPVCLGLSVYPSIIYLMVSQQQHCWYSRPGDSLSWVSQEIQQHRWPLPTQYQ